MVNFKKILVLLQLFVRFLTPITLRAETNIGVNPEQVAPPPAEDTNVFSQFATTIDAKQEMFCMTKRISPRISC